VALCAAGCIGLEQQLEPAVSEPEPEPEPEQGSARPSKPNDSQEQSPAGHLGPSRTGSAVVSVRPWTLADFPAVSALLGDVLRPLTLTHASVARHSRKRLEKELPRDAAALSAGRSPNDATWQMFVAVSHEEGGDGSTCVVGCIGLRMSNDCATLDRLAVVETWRRRGVARALVEAAQAQAEQQHRMHAETFVTPAPLRMFATTVDADARAAAVALWGHMGYSESGPRRQIGKKGAPLALVSFEKQLSS
jgi:GNAT superfamily N-acetyltransferase